MAEQVAGRTASDLKNADVFEREADGATTDTEAAKASADELAGECSYSLAFCSQT